MIKRFFEGGDSIMPINKNEITKEMLGKALQCETVEDLLALAKAEGIELTKEEAEAYLDELSEYELKDGDLKHIAGGKYTRGSWCNEFCVDKIKKIIFPSMSILLNLSCIYNKRHLKKQKRIWQSWRMWSWMKRF